MLKEMGVLGLGKLALALILFCGPGYGLFSFFPNRKLFDKTLRVILAFTLSVSFWALLMAWFQLLNIRLSGVPILVIALSGWGVGIARQVRVGDFLPARPRFFKDIERFLLWGVLTAIVLIGLWQVRNTVVGLGSDSYHHTLIAQLIMTQGGLPENYQPITDQIVTFTYHFGFHVTVAVLGWLSGIPLHWVVLAIGIVFIALSALSMAFLTEMMTGSRQGGLVAAIVTGIVCVFPTFMLNWGRYPQLAGLILLPVFLGLFKQELESGFDFRRLAFLSFLAAGLGTVHYRVSLITMVGAGSLLAAMWAGGRFRSMKWKELFLKLLIIGLGTLLLFLPWIWHVVKSRSEGFPLVVSQNTSSFYSISRLGPAVLNVPTNLILLAILAVALVWGVLRKDWIIFWVILWTGACLVFSQPVFAGVFMDSISVLISLYIPLSVALGWLAVEIGKLDNRPAVWRKRMAALFAVGVTLWSLPIFARNVNVGVPFVQSDDLKAIEWIRNNTPSSAYFMVNLYHFEFLPELIISMDAGYWLPLLAERKTVSLPMSYISEKFNSSEGINELKALDALNGHLCSIEAEKLLAKDGVTHVYVGSAGGSIAVPELLNCPGFFLEYQHNKAYVFRFTAPGELGGMK